MASPTLPTYVHELPDTERLWPTVRQFCLDTGFTAPCLEWPPCVVKTGNEGQRLTLYFVDGYTSEGIRLNPDQLPIELSASDPQVRELHTELDARCTYTLSNFWGDTVTLNFSEPHIPVHGYKGFYERTLWRIRGTLRVLTEQGYHTRGQDSLFDVAIPKGRNLSDK